MSLTPPEPTFRDRPRPYAKDINRLISSVSPTGKIIWEDDFEAGIQQWMHSGDVGYSVTQSNVRAFQGGYSCRLATPPTTGQYAGIERTFGYVSRSKYGFEFWVHLETTNLDRIHVYLEYWTGTLWHPSRFEYFGDNGPLPNQWYVEDGAVDNWVLLGTHKLYEGALATGGRMVWHHIKGVIDPENLKWVKLIVDDEIFNLSPYDLVAGTADTTAKRICLAIFVYTAANSACEVFVDDAVATCEEP